MDWDTAVQGGGGGLHHVSRYLMMKNPNAREQLSTYQKSNVCPKQANTTVRGF